MTATIGAQSAQLLGIVGNNPLKPAMAQQHDVNPARFRGHHLHFVVSEKVLRVELKGW